VTLTFSPPISRDIPKMARLIVPVLNYPFETLGRLPHHRQD
jgi:hypothetical protein